VNESLADTGIKMRTSKVYRGPIHSVITIRKRWQCVKAQRAILSLPYHFH